MRKRLPETEDEFQRREAVGVIRASRFVRRYAKSHKPITFETICEIHNEIFRDAWPEIAGKYRQENLKITDSRHLPPHYSQVASLMKAQEDELREKLKGIENVAGTIKDGQGDDLVIAMIDRVIRVAAWLHHIITFAHPFREGNGRTARLAGNLILERYGLVGISIKVEKENKNRYRRALAQIDKQKDFEPLVELIGEGLLDRYDGVAMKYYSPRK